MKITNNKSYISGLVLIAALILFSNIGVAIQYFFRILSRLFLDPVEFIPLFLCLLIIICFGYLSVAFFITAIRAYKERNSFLFYFNHFTALLIMLFCLLNFCVTLIASFLSYGFSTIVIVGLLFQLIFLALEIILLFNLRKNQHEFLLSKDKLKNIIKLFILNILASVVAYIIINYIYQYFALLNYRILTGVISVILILPFYGLWKKIIGTEKHCKPVIFLSFQIIITNLIMAIISIITMSMTVFGL